MTVYESGPFVDLCKGPHVKSTGEIKHFKLFSIAGAYWRGSEKREQLQRIYGTAFFTKDELEELFSYDRYINNIDYIFKRIGI